MLPGDHDKSYEDRPFPCEICLKRFRLRGSLRIHQRIHFGLKPYKCTKCNASFSDQTNFNRHKKIHLSSRPRPYKCLFCLKAFCVKYSLTRHLELHIIGKRFKCDLCHKGFSRKYDLKRHWESHEIEGETYTCFYCSNTFPTKLKIRSHMKSHLNQIAKVGKFDDKKFSCEHCRKSFRRFCDLKSHMRNHSGEHPYQCNFCNAAFKHKNLLLRHMRMNHPHYSFFTCGVCFTSFPVECDLRYHYRDAHGMTYKHFPPRSLSKEEKAEFFPLDFVNQGFSTENMTANKELQYYCVICRDTSLDHRTFIKHVEGHRKHSLNLNSHFSETENIIKEEKIILPAEYGAKMESSYGVGRPMEI